MSEPHTETPQSHLTVGDQREAPTPHSQAPTPQSAGTDKDGSGDHDGENPFDIELTEVLVGII